VQLLLNETREQFCLLNVVVTASAKELAGVSTLSLRHNAKNELNDRQVPGNAETFNQSSRLCICMADVYCGLGLRGRSALGGWTWST
jgi:hypothetical protein